ncbi:MAG: peptidoglycan DD-metalloendopeptidase family protein [Helicobacter sp.]|nr:peptidoglycan DD-metalloendopeptidase family protein [Helicobacter sp.]
MKNSIFIYLFAKQRAIGLYISSFWREIIIFIAIAFASFASFIAISFIASIIEYRNLKNDLNFLQNRLAKTLEQHQNITKRLNQSQESISQIDSKILDFENKIGQSLGQDAELFDRINLSKLDGAQKAFVMKLLPNGFPLKQFVRISAPFGKRIHPILHFVHFHTGIDFSVKLNSPVFATADGVVDFASMGQNKGYGGFVKLTHAFGFKTYYAHLNSIKVRYGEFVKKGQIIAYSGNTGISTAPHLHYEVRFLNTPLDPKNFIAWNLRNYDGIFIKERKVSWDSLINLINKILAPQ